MMFSMPENDIQVAFSDEGSGAPTVLLIHGHPFNRTLWRPQIEFLRTRCRVIVPDLRGYGETAMAVGATVGNSRFCGLNARACSSLPMRAAT
jgi:pimeloyl-ACP methyl ester carboxylesterase